MKEKLKDKSAWIAYMGLTIGAALMLFAIFGAKGCYV